MVKSYSISVIVLTLSTQLLFAGSVPKPSKVGLLWASPGIEEVVEYYMCMQCHELYNLDWISNVPAYQEATTRLELTNVVYECFMEHKLNLQRENISRIGHWCKRYLAIGTLLSATTRYGYNYGVPIVHGCSQEGGIGKFFDKVQGLADAHKKMKDPFEELAEMGDQELEGILSRGEAPKGVEELEDFKAIIVERWTGKSPEEKKNLRDAWQKEYQIPWWGAIQKAAGMEKRRDITWGNVFWTWSVGIGSISSMQSLCLPVLIHRLTGSLFYSALEFPMEDVYEKIEEDYVKHYFAMREGNPQLLAEIQDKMCEFREALGRSSYFYKELVSTAVKLPLHRGKFVFDQEKFAQCYAFYPKGIKKVLANIMGRMCFFGTSKTTPSTNFPLYFQGIPGSGKTYAVNSITPVTGAPVSHITLDGGSIEEIIGTAYGKPGRLLTALTKGEKSGATNFSNGVLFIDEFDRLLSDSLSNASSKALLSFMLKMLDPSNRKFFSPYLNCYIDLPSTIILAGNYEITDPALANRFQIVKFDGYDEELKWGIAREYLVPKIAGIYGFVEIDQEDLEAIYALVRDDTEDAGVRSIELKIIKYFEEKRMESFLPRDSYGTSSVAEAQHAEQ